MSGRWLRSPAVLMTTRERLTQRWPAMPVQLPPIGREEDGPFHAFAYRKVDRPGGACGMVTTFPPLLVMRRGRGAPGGVSASGRTDDPDRRCRGGQYRAGLVSQFPRQE